MLHTLIWMLPLRFFGVCDGYGGKVVAKFCAKYLQQQVLKNEAYTDGDLGTSVQKFFFGMDKLNAGKAKMLPLGGGTRPCMVT